METRREFQEFVEISESHVESTTVVYEVQESFTTSFSTRSISYNTSNSTNYATINEDESTTYSTLTAPATSTEVVYTLTSENVSPVLPLTLPYREVELIEDNSTNFTTSCTTHTVTPVVETQVYTITTEIVSVPPLHIPKRDVKLIEERRASIDSCNTPAVSTEDIYSFTIDVANAPPVPPVPGAYRESVSFVEERNGGYVSTFTETIGESNTHVTLSNVTNSTERNEERTSLHSGTWSPVNTSRVILKPDWGSMSPRRTHFVGESTTTISTTATAPVTSSEFIHKVPTEHIPPVPPLSLTFSSVKLITNGEDEKASNGTTHITENTEGCVVNSTESKGEDVLCYTQTWSGGDTSRVILKPEWPSRRSHFVRESRTSFSTTATAPVTSIEVIDMKDFPPVPPLSITYPNVKRITNGEEDTEQADHCEHFTESNGGYLARSTESNEEAVSRYSETWSAADTSRVILKPEWGGSSIGSPRRTHFGGESRTSFSTTTTIPVMSTEFIHKLPTQDIPPVPPLSFPHSNARLLTNGDDDTPPAEDCRKDEEPFATIVEVPLDEAEQDQRRSQQPSRQQPSRSASTVPPSRRCNGNCRPERVDQASQLFSLAGGRSSFNPVFRILLITLLIVLANLGMAALLYFYLYASRIEWNAIRIVSAVPQGTVLLLTSLSVKVVIICIPFLMAMMALYVASAWMRNKRSITQVERLPCGCIVTDSNTPVTPVIANEQYGLMLGLFKGATIFTLWGTMKYMVFPSSSSASGPSGKRGSLSKPLIQVFSVLFIAILLLYSLLSVDLALHHLSSTKSIPIKALSLPIPAAASSDPKLYSRSLKAECNQRDTNGNACTVHTSGVTALAAAANGNNAQTADFREGLKTLVGISSTDSVVFATLDGQKVALLTSPESTYTSGDGFKAHTTGIRTTCSVISPSCDTSTACTASHHPPTTHTTTDFTTGTCAAFSCSASGWPTFWEGGRTNSSGLFVSEPLEIRGEDSLYRLQTPPANRATDLSTFRFFASLSSFVDNATLATECTSTSSLTGLCSRGKDEGYVYGGDITVQRVPNYRQLVTGCRVEVLDVEFEYLDGTYTIVKDSVKAADNSTSLALSSVLYTRDARLTALGVALSNLASSGSSSSDVARALEEGVGKIMLAMGHTAFEPASVLNLIWSVHAPATILPTAAVMLFIVILVLFAVLAIALGVLAILGINKGLWDEKRRVDAALKRSNQTTPQPISQLPPLSYLQPPSEPACDTRPPGLSVPRALSPLGSSIREKDGLDCHA